MIDKQDIIARLQAGDTMDEIVEEITTTINDAESEYKSLQENEEKEAERQYKAKKEAVFVIFDGLCDFMVAAGADDMLEEIHQFDSDKAIQVLDSSIAIARSMSQMKQYDIADIFNLFI